MAEVLLTGKARDLCFRLAKIADEDNRVFDVVEHKEKRSLSSNGYYWLLNGKVADKLRISKTRLHNDMLRHYGQMMMIDDKPVCVMIPDTTEAEESAWESDTVHIKPTSVTILGENGINYRQYVMLRGSSDYNSSEMAILISGIVQEAKQLNIETLTPRELEEMFRLERKAEEKHYAEQKRN